MIDRIICGPPRSRLARFVVEEVVKFADQEDLAISIVANSYIFDQWKEDIPGAQHVSYVKFFHTPPVPCRRIYVVDVPHSVLDRIRTQLHTCADLVWIMQYKTGDL